MYTRDEFDQNSDITRDTERDGDDNDTADTKIVYIYIHTRSTV